MKKLLIIIFFIFSLFLYGCRNNILNPNTENSSKIMYIKFKVSGKSSQKNFNYRGENTYPKEVSIKNYYNNDTYTYTGKIGDNGYHYIYNFCDDQIGNSMSIPFYIGDSKLKISYNDKDKEIIFKGYIWLGNSGKLFFRNNFDVKISLKNYDEEKNNNTALISIILYPDNDTYQYTFDGFESK